MVTVALILLVLAALCFAASAAGVQSRVNLTAAGLFCWVLSLLVG